MNKRDDKKMTGLFWTGLVLSTGEASNFYIEEFSGPADCLGKTLIALLTVGTGVSEKTLANVKCRMEARACAAPVFLENGIWQKNNLELIGHINELEKKIHEQRMKNGN